MKNILLGLTLLLGMAVHSQDLGTVGGTVIDAEMYGEPLLMAHVALTEAKASTLTNFHGNFEFTHVEPGDYTLHISFLGYEDLKMPITVKAGERVEIMEALGAKDLTLGTEPTLSSTADAQEQPFTPTGLKP